MWDDAKTRAVRSELEVSSISKNEVIASMLSVVGAGRKHTAHDINVDREALEDYQKNQRDMPDTIASMGREKALEYQHNKDLLTKFGDLAGNLTFDRMILLVLIVVVAIAFYNMGVNNTVSQFLGG